LNGYAFRFANRKHCRAKHVNIVTPRTWGLAENKKFGDNQRNGNNIYVFKRHYRSHHKTQRMDIMIIAATEVDGPQILDITARTGVFTQEEVDCVRDLWEDYLTTGPVVGGYNFIVDREGDRVLGFACYGPRDLTSGVFDLYWIAVDSKTHRNGVGRKLLTATEEAVQQAGGRMLIAETSGTPHYEPTRKFYLGMGYVMEATIRDFYVEDDDLAIFVKRF
jgi:ribosomal protein S18 acetylase RimI-like enzyme